MSPHPRSSSRRHEGAEGSDETKPLIDRIRSVPAQSECANIKGINFFEDQGNQQGRTWRMRLDPLKQNDSPPVPAERGPSREHISRVLSSIYFHWLSPLLTVGYQRPLELNDIWTVSPNRSVNVLVPKFRHAMQARKDGAGKLNVLGMALIETLKNDFVVGGICQLTAAILQLLTPFVLRYLLDFAAEAYAARYDTGKTVSVGRGVGIVTGLASMQLIQSLCTNSSFYRASMMVAQARSILITCICAKSYDRIMVMDAGSLAAFDSPLNLYDQGGIFRNLCERSRIKREQILLAKEGMRPQSTTLPGSLEP